MRLRLLPVTMFALALLLSVKAGDIWHAGGRPVMVADLRAETPADKPDAAAAEGAGAPTAKSDGASAPDEHADEAKANEQAPDAPIDISRLTRHDVELLQQLAQRRRALDERARTLDLKEQLVAAAERKLDDKIAELKTIEAKIEGLLKKHDAQEDAKLESLVKIYEKMKPKEAARIFENLDMPILLSVVERMKEARTAPILAAMDPRLAKEVTAALATRRALPEAADPAEGAKRD